MNNIKERNDLGEIWSYSEKSYQKTFTNRFLQNLEEENKKTIILLINFSEFFK